MAKSNIERAQRLMLRHPKMTAQELADKLGIGLNYSYVLRAQIKKRKDTIHTTRAEALVKARAAKKAKALAKVLPVSGNGDEYEQKGGKWEVVSIVTSDKPLPKPDRKSTRLNSSHT